MFLSAKDQYKKTLKKKERLERRSRKHVLREISKKIKNATSFPITFVVPWWEKCGEGTADEICELLISKGYEVSTEKQAFGIWFTINCGEED